MNESSTQDSNTSKDTRHSDQTTKIVGGVSIEADQVNIGGDVVGRDKVSLTVKLKPWAWVAGIVILALTLLFVAGIFNIGPLRTLLPTPMAFRPAKSESLIIVADFDDRSGSKYKGIDPAQYIYEQLVAQANKDKLDVRIERLRQVVNDNTVRRTGEVYGATLVLWGWYDALTITPRMERIKIRSDYYSTEEELHLSLADPTKVELNIVTDLPDQETYLTLFTLGIDEYTNTNNDKALAYFDSALAAILQKSTVATNPYEAHFFRGNIYFDKNNYDYAIANYDKAIQLRSDYAEAYNNRGFAYSYKGDYNRAIADFDQAIQLEPDAQTYANRGAIYQIKGDYDHAITDFDKAIQLQPDYAEAYNNRGLTYYDKQDYDRAFADFDKVVRLKPDEAAAYNNRGLAHTARGDYNRAIADFDKAIQLKPDFAMVYVNRGWAYVLKPDPGRAIADFDKAIQLKPDFVVAYYDRGMVSSATGDNDRAIANWNKVIQLMSGYARAYYNRGVNYKRKADRDRAITDFEKVLELSDDPNLRQLAEEQLKELGAK